MYLFPAGGLALGACLGLSSSAAVGEKASQGWPQGRGSQPQRARGTILSWVLPAAFSVYGIHVASYPGLLSQPLKELYKGRPGYEATCSIHVHVCVQTVLCQTHHCWRVS